MTAPLVRRSGLASKTGTEVSTLKVSLLVNGNVTQGNVPLTLFAQQGGFDGCRLTVRRFFAETQGHDPVGYFVVFSGTEGGVRVSASEVSIDVKSDMQVLDTKLPRNLYSAQCGRTVYDPGCGVSRSAFAVSAEVTSNGTVSLFDANLPQASGYFSLGSVTFLTGRNEGQTRTVKTFAGGAVGLMFPLPFAPQAGDALQIVPGCDNTWDTCTSKFGNQGNFRGFPYIPVPEVSY